MRTAGEQEALKSVVVLERASGVQRAHGDGLRLADATEHWQEYRLAIPLLRLSCTAGKLG